MSKEVEVVDEDERPAGAVGTIEVELTGGPLGREATLLVEGQRVPKVTSARVIADVGDAIRLQTEQILVHASISVKAAKWEKTVVAKVGIWSGHPGTDAEMEEITGRGPTVLEALKDVVTQLETQLKKEPADV